MGKRKLLIVSAASAFVVAIGVFVYLINVSKAFSYLSDDPKACINCHVMNTQYATWEHSAHREAAVCNDCHLPNSGVTKYIAKARDGFNHATAFTFGTFENAIVISPHGAERVQANCMECHNNLARRLLANDDLNHAFGEKTPQAGRFCWECHRETPHGKVRALATTPQNLGVQVIK
ncbi:cytochrome c-type protein [Campylobacterota bacterium]|nr:cytochrome c-type protein [Campylobacterota bacterium]